MYTVMKVKNFVPLIAEIIGLKIFKLSFMVVLIIFFFKMLLMIITRKKIPVFDIK